MTALPLAHGIPSPGYRIEEEEQPGSLKVDKLKKLGLPPGPLYQGVKGRKDHSAARWAKDTRNRFYRPTEAWPYIGNPW